MPANLTPEYEKADLRYRQAVTDEERVRCLEEMLAAIPKHKGTEKMQADLKRRLSHLRKTEQKSVHKGPDPFHIPKTGAGQVVLVGPPNTGKSSLLAATTHAEVRIADYPFTTSVPQPGIWERDDLQIELVDTPALTPSHVPTGLMGTIRNADLVCIVISGGGQGLEQATETLEILQGRGINVASLPRNQARAAGPDLYPGLVLLNKSELDPQETIRSLAALLPGLDVLSVSAQQRTGLDPWFHRLRELLAVVRVYSKQPGKPADLQKPFVLPLGATILDLARLIHRDLPDHMKYARLWGHSRFEGQQVHKTEPLRDRDIVEIHE